VSKGQAEPVVDGKTVPHPEGEHAGTSDALPVDPDLLQAPGSVDRRGGARPPWLLSAVIATGGFAGGLARYGIGLAAPAAHGTFPVATFAINVSGSFILALLIVLVLEVLPPTTYVRPLLGVGFCGAFTTFSTWMVGADQLFSTGHPETAVGYLCASVAAGLAATSLGLTVGRSIAAHRRVRHDGGPAETVERAAS
jgi:CrcB protein